MRVASHQLGGADLGIHQAVEEVTLLLALDRDVVLLRVVDVELAGQEGVALGGHLDELVPGRLHQRRHHLQPARLGLEPDPQDAEVIRPIACFGTHRTELGDVALLPVGQLREQTERGLVGDGVEMLEVEIECPQERRLRLAVGQLDVGRRRIRRPEAVEQRRQLLGRGARIVARMAKLVETAAHLADRPGVVVKVVGERVLDLELRRQREPARGEVNQLSEQVEVVREPDRVLVHVVAEPEPVRRWCHVSIPPLVHPHHHPARRANAACDGRQRSGVGRHPRRR